MRRLLFAFMLLLAHPTAQAQGPANPAAMAAVPYGQHVLLAPGDSAFRQFGDLLLCYRLARSGAAMQCTLYVATQLAGVRQLSAASPLYPFDLQLGYGKACGTLVLQLAPGQQGQISTLTGNFSYTANSTTFVFKGDLIGWRIIR